MKNFLIKIIAGKVNPDFYRLFLLKEGKELLGEKYKNFWILLTILFGTFLTIGFANGSLEYLEKKMSDPFVNWVSVEVPLEKKDNIQNTVLELQAEDVKEEYQLDTITGYFELLLQLTGPEKNNSNFFMGRSISAQSPIQSQVLSGKNHIRGKKTIHEKDFGLILTRDVFNQLGYSPESPLVYMPLSINDTLKLNAPLPVLAIVEELPGLADFAFTPYFYYQRILSSSNPFRIDKYKTLHFLVENHSSNTEESMKEISDSIVSFYDDCSFLDFGPRENIQEDAVYHEAGIKAEISFFPQPSPQKLDSIFKEIQQAPQFENYSLTRIYNYEFNYISAYNKDDFHLLSVYFKDLNNIREFKDYLKLEHDMEIDMSLIEAKENYNFISRLTRIISVILIAFSIFSLSLFTSNVFVRHVEKIGMNLGTFKAFGLNNTVLKKIYLLLIFALLVAAIILSLVTAWILGELGIINLVLAMLDYTLESNQDFFNLASYWTLLFVIFILGALFAFLNKMTNRQLKKTPGDLIYGRD